MVPPMPDIPFDPTKAGFDRLIGYTIDHLGEDEARAHVAVAEHLTQPMGLVHGGVYASIAESVTSTATAFAVIPDGNIATGQSNQTSFLRPITEGTIHMVARRRHRGRTSWVWDVEFLDDAGRLCAVVRMTIAVRPMPPGLEPPQPR
jgi:1,4-dihydroxy-2-naphthoyl-CoA hydrolase